MKSHFFAYISRMRFIQRWALMRNTAPENVQEHSHQVAVLAHALGVVRNEKVGGRLAAGAAAEGKKTGIIAADETAPLYRHGIVRSIGSRQDEEEIARHLYGVLRDFDSDGADVIYSEAFYTPRMGQAIMNRLLKAAGHKLIEAK